MNTRERLFNNHLKYLEKKAGIQQEEKEVQSLLLRVVSFLENHPEYDAVNIWADKTFPISRLHKTLETDGWYVSEEIKEGCLFITIALNFPYKHLALGTINLLPD